jgi:glucokinase
MEIYASVDLGGSKIAAMLASSGGEVLAERSVPTFSQEGPEGVLKRVATLVLEMAEAAGRRPAALGMGVPGLIDLERGVTKFLPNLPSQWRDIPVRETLQAQLGCPIYMLNDARMATLGEMVYGHGQSSSTMVYFTLGTGIGGGVAIDGKLRLGPFGAAGELGHQTVLPGGARCGCGNRGCLETLASGPVLTSKGVWLMLSGRAPRLYELVNGDASKITPREMARAADLGDEAVREEIIRAAQYLGIGVANLVTALHPDLVVFSGGMSDIGPLLFDTVREVVQRRVRMFPPDNVRIERSLLGDRAGMWGGIALALKRGRAAI